MFTKSFDVIIVTKTFIASLMCVVNWFMFIFKVTNHINFLVYKQRPNVQNV